jgi:hypothetical protein
MRGKQPFRFAIACRTQGGHIVLEHLAGRPRDRHQPLSAALAGDGHEAAVRHRRADREPDQLGNAQARGIEKFKQAMQPECLQPLFSLGRGGKRLCGR